MKIFSVLLLQCKKVPCRMESTLLPKGCTIKVELHTPDARDIEFMNAQIDTICSVSNQQNTFVLLSIMNACMIQCNIISETYTHDMFITKEEIEKIIEMQSFTAALSKDRLACLYTILFRSRIEDGALVCTKCQELYPISNGIIDFVNKDEV